MDKIVVSGGTGLIGSALIRGLAERGNDVVILTRKDNNVSENNRVRYVQWDAQTAAGSWIKELEDASVIINLAGENLGAGYWTSERKKRLLNSRLNATQALYDAIKRSSNKPRLFIQASAIGIYGISATLVMNELTQPGGDYLAEVGKKLEASTLPIEKLGIKRAIIRTGIVLDMHKGALPKLLLPYKLLVGGRLGSGNQWLSWIHLKDEVNAILYIIDQHLDGVFNLTAPIPVTNAEAGRIISKVLRMPNWFPIPGFLLKAILGEMSTLVLDGQNVVPARLLKEGFTFEFSDFESAFRNLMIKK